MWGVLLSGKRDNLGVSSFQDNLISFLKRRSGELGPRTANGLF